MSGRAPVAPVSCLTAARPTTEEFAADVRIDACGRVFNVHSCLLAVRLPSLFELASCSDVAVAAPSVPSPSPSPSPSAAAAAGPPSALSAAPTSPPRASAVFQAVSSLAPLPTAAWSAALLAAVFGVVVAAASDEVRVLSSLVMSVMMV